MIKERELLKRMYNQFATIWPSDEEQELLDEVEKLLTEPEENPVYKCIQIIDDIKEIAIENEWHIDEAMSSAVFNIMKCFNMLNGEDNV